MRVRALAPVIGLAASLLVGAASAATPIVLARSVSPPDSQGLFITPTPEQFAAAYPRDAHGEGRVYLSCGLTAQGRLQGCQVVSETPAQQGFGRAALSLARLYRFPTDLVDDGSGMVSLSLQIGRRSTSLGRFELTALNGPPRV